MSQIQKILLNILSGTKDTNISFSDLQKILTLLGFVVRIKGDHFIYTKDGIDEIINIQPIGNKAKPYQVKQVRNIILKYKLGGNLNV
ncbi:MAG: type II toxin-antitoxin system HicA family toxin [Oscillospiraceae bacterium]